MLREQGDGQSHHAQAPARGLLHPFGIVFGNAQSWLSGVVGGLLFVPTTIGAMVWATSFLHTGQHLPMADAASNAPWFRSAGSSAVRCLATSPTELGGGSQC